MSKIIATVPDHSSETGFTELNLTKMFGADTTVEEAKIALQNQGYLEGTVAEVTAEGTNPENVADLAVW